MWIYKLVETDFIPETIIRIVVRAMLSQKLKEEQLSTPQKKQERLMQFVEELKLSPIAIETKAANKQHYELPTSFFQLILGPNLKYSCALWNNPQDTLEQAEENMLSLYCKRAEITDGQSILDLGCGWGSMSLYLAKNYPNSKITALSNSSTQREYIENKANQLKLNNLKVITANISEYSTESKYDRIVSIEMFEHMKNYQELLRKLKIWLLPKGKLFVHIFCHKDYAYNYDSETDWLAEHFFSGGTMPSNDLLLYFQNDFSLSNHWVIDGEHYKKTANAWLANMKKHKKNILSIISSTYGDRETKKWWVYWKLFFIACAETWGYQKGSQWLVSHYLFE